MSVRAVKAGEVESPEVQLAADILTMACELPDLDHCRVIVLVTRPHADDSERGRAGVGAHGYTGENGAERMLQDVMHHMQAIGKAAGIEINFGA